MTRALSAETEKRAKVDGGAPDPTLAMARKVVKLLKREWFGARFGADARYVVPLVLSIFVAARMGKPLSKKATLEATGAEDIKTARKYVALIEAMGLVRTERAAHDKRQELLWPTGALDGLLKREMEQIGVEWNEDMRMEAGVGRVDFVAVGEADVVPIAEFVDNPAVIDESYFGRGDARRQPVKDVAEARAEAQAEQEWVRSKGEFPPDFARHFKNHTKAGVRRYMEETRARNPHLKWSNEDVESHVNKILSWLRRQKTHMPG